MHARGRFGWHVSPRPQHVAERQPEEAEHCASYIVGTPRELADIAGQLASRKGEAHACLRDPDYDALKHRLENAHAAVEGATVEARRRVRLNEGR